MAGAWIDGKPVALAAAAAHAAKLLAASRLPLIGGLATDVAGARAAIALAERVGGVVDHMHSDALMRDLDVMRESGMMITTPGEARGRGDLILLVGPGLRSAWPGLAERLLDGPLASEAGAGRRRIIWLCPGRDRSNVPPLRSSPRKLESEPSAAQHGPENRSAAADIQIVGRKPDDLPGILAALRARVNDRPTNKVGVPAKALDALAAELKAAAFGVAVWSAAALDTLTIDMLCGLVRDLNAGTRFSGLPLAPGGNAVGVQQACGWMTGFPMRTSFARGYPEHDPWRFDARRLVASGEADCVLYISAYECDVVAFENASLDTIALVGPDTATRVRAKVVIEVARPGLDHDAVDYSAEAGTLVHRRASAPGDAMSVADAVALIAAQLPDAGTRPC